MNNESNEKNEDKDEETDLKSLVNEIQQREKKRIEQEDRLPEEPGHIRKIDVLNLPPRTEVHGKQKTRTHVKFSKPLLRLLIVIIILLGIIIGAYFIWGEELLTLISDL